MPSKRLPPPESSSSSPGSSESEGEQDKEMIPLSPKPTTNINISEEDEEYDGSEEEEEENLGICSNKLLYPTLYEIVAQLESSTGNCLFMRAFHLIKPSMGKALEEKWKRQRVEEMKLYVERLDLKMELNRALLEALRHPTS